MSMEGRRVGSYQIESLLAVGVSGTVYRAARTDGDHFGALKVINLKRLRVSDRGQFMQKMNAIRSLRHPNIVEIDEVGDVNGQVYVAMELLEHGSLRTLMDRARGTGQPLPLGIGLQIVKQAAEGISFAHENGVVHSDLKPENMLLKSSTDSPTKAHWVVKISDFGFAGAERHSSDRCDDSEDQFQIYEAPEQRTGGAPSPRGDVFALGAIFYEVVTSRRPELVTNDADEENHHVVTAPRDLNPAISGELDAVITRCLSRDPADRFANGSEVVAAIAAAAGSASSARNVGVPIDGQRSATLEVDAIEYRLTLTQGDGASIDLHISNHSDDAVDLRVETESTELVAFPDLPRLLRLEVEQRKSISVAVRLDVDHRPLPGEYRLLLHVRPTDPDSTVIEVPISLIVEPEMTTQLTLQAVGRESARRAIYHAIVDNESDRLEHVSLHARDWSNRLRFRFSPVMVAIEPGRSRTITLEVSDTIRRNDSGSVGFEVTAQPSNGPAVTSVATFNRSSKESSGARRVLVGFGALSTMAAVLAVVLLASFMRGGSSHAIAETPSPIAAQTPTPMPTQAVAIVPTVQPTPTAVQPTPTSAPTATPPPTVTPTTDAPIAVKQVKTAKDDVALTFSVGNDPTSAVKVESILTLLKSRNVVASFGISGVWAQAHPDLVRQIVEDGNQLINETYDHTSFTGSSAPDSVTSTAGRAEELTRADQIFKQITGESPAPFYRPPYGDIDSGPNSSVERDAATAGYSVAVLWSIDTMSWSSSQTVGKMIAAASKAKPGDIILFNIAPAGGDKDVSALPQIIDNLHGAGLAFLTVADLMGR